MTASDYLTARFDAFQNEAVQAIESDFQNTNNGRYLLVIPTGGGKTFTAVKAVNRLFETQILDVAVDRVLWLAHRNELVQQANDTFEQFEKQNPGRSFRQCVSVMMISRLSEQMASEKHIRLVVIDEAHHAAANSYQAAFANSQIGILGLTATPSRHDGAPLGFERESFSIGFPDLVQRGIVLRPEVRRVVGGRYNFTFDDGDAGLDQLDNRERNTQILQALLAHRSEYRKIIIFVGTIRHVRSLHEVLTQSELAHHYESITWITGGERSNSAGMDRTAFIKARKAERRSIIVNVDVLTEGYDDPAVNTVVMASPTRSKLVYMQAMGRAIRHDFSDESKKAFIVEVVDELPNIRYRIDNRWLYADISDTLEPAVSDRLFDDSNSLLDSLHALYDEYSVPEEYRSFPEFDDGDRYSLLLFKYYVRPGVFQHLPILITRANRLQVSSSFNYLSEHMVALRSRVNWSVAIRRSAREPELIFGDELRQRLIFDAMANSTAPGESEKAGMPWITFVSFRRRPSAIPESLRDFCGEMVNRDEILQRLERRDYMPGDILLRMPLPLGRSIGVIVDTATSDEFGEFLSRLDVIKADPSNEDHYLQLRGLLDDTTFPMPSRYVWSAVLISRDGSDYLRRLN